MSNKNTWVTKKKRIAEQAKQEWEKMVKEYEKQAQERDEQLPWWDQEHDKIWLEND